MKKKTDSYLGFAKKSGNLVSGTGTCKVMADRGKLKLLIIAEDIAEGSMEKMKKLAASGDIPYRIYGLSDHLSQVTGMHGRSVFGITDKQFADIVTKQIDTEQSSEKEVF